MREFSWALCGQLEVSKVFLTVFGVFYRFLIRALLWPIFVMVYGTLLASSFYCVNSLNLLLNLRVLNSVI